MAGGDPKITGILLPSLSVGSVIAGYRLEEQVGVGGMAVVFRAVDERLGRLVALKVLAPALASDEAFRQRFIRESRAAAAVDDPHIIPVHEAGEANGVLFIAMRYVAGTDVRALLHRQGPLSPGQTAAIISPTASALDAAHAAGLVHRDVKPANMLLDVRPGRPDHLYLSDFGLSKAAMSSSGLTTTGQFVGTPNYTAPEQIEGKPVDGRTDQYSLACAAFEMLTGQTLFQRDDLTAMIWAHLSTPPPPLTSRRPDLPVAADHVFGRALSKAPADRYRSCGEFADALRESLGIAQYDSGPEAAAIPARLAPSYPPTQPAWSSLTPDASPVTSAPENASTGLNKQVADGTGPSESGSSGVASPDERLAEHVPPKTIMHAVRLMYVGAALPFVIAMLAYLIPGITASGQASGLLTGLLSYGFLASLWLWMAWGNRTGRAWARIVATEFFGILTCAGLFGLFGLIMHFTGRAGRGVPDATVLTATALFLVYWLAGLCAIVLLWRQSSSDYYAAARNRAEPDPSD